MKIDTQQRDKKADSWSFEDELYEEILRLDSSGPEVACNVRVPMQLVIDEVP